MRCEDGSVIDTGLPSQAKEWHDAAKIQCNRDGHFRGVTLDKTDILDAIQERAGKHNVGTIYFATDGWMRGPQGVRLVQETVEGLRQRGLTVVGLWKVPGLSNFNDSKFFDPVETFGPNNQVRNQISIRVLALAFAHLNRSYGVRFNALKQAPSFKPPYENRLRSHVGFFAWPFLQRVRRSTVVRFLGW